MRRFVSLLVLTSVLLLPARALAQAERYEVGQRLIAAEAAWQKKTDPAARKRALPFLIRSTQTFLNFLGGEDRLRSVGQSLDRARFSLLSDREPSPAVLWAESLWWQPEGRLFDTKSGELTVTLASFYPVKTALLKEASLELCLLDGRGRILSGKCSKAITSLPFKICLPLIDVPEGDHRLRADIVKNGILLARTVQPVSLANGLAKRLEKLRKGVAGLPKKPPDTQAETVRGMMELLDLLARSQPQETGYPAAMLLSEMEKAVEAIGAGKEFYGLKKSGEFWLTLALGKEKVPARLAAPAAVAGGRPLPLVISIHGTGGSENVVFDAHGPGLIVRLCKERGWLLVAPRSTVYGPPSIASVIAEVDKLYPVDRRRVFLVGHSIGGTHAVNVAHKMPTLFAGVAALAPSGGGGTASAALKKLPFFVCVGSRDFLRPAGRRLRDALKKEGVEKVEFREYADVDHLTILVEGLGHVFEFFDKAPLRK